jgi:integrase
MARVHGVKPSSSLPTRGRGLHGASAVHLRAGAREHSGQPGRMMTVYDRWHKSRPAPGEPGCAEHGKAPTADHGKPGRWQARWRDDTGEQRKRNFTRKADADAHEVRALASLAAGTYVNAAAGRQRVRDYAATWRADLQHRASTAERISNIFRLHVDDLPLGGMAMASVRPSHIRAWAKDRAQVVAPSTLNLLWVSVSSMFGAGVLDRVIGVSPFAGLKTPAARPVAHFIPDAGQIRTVIDALPERYRAAAWLAAGCGWRRNEILGLETASLDFLHRTTEVRQQLGMVTGSGLFLSPPKTATSARVSEVPEVARLALARHLELFPSRPVMIEDRTTPHKPVMREASFVFTTSTGAPVHPAWWAKIWRTAADAAGIPQGTGVHCLRHYFATVLIHNGASVKDVQLAMGHATPTITLNTYAGEWPGTGQRTRAIVDAALADVSSVCPREVSES